MSLLCTLSTASIIYNSGTSVVRFIYIRSSLARNVQDVLKRDSFVIKSIFIGESICAFNFLSLYWLNDEQDQNSPWPLYRACLDPWMTFKIPFSELMPVNQAILHTSTFINIFFNLWLFGYLNKMTNQNTALRASDKKREKKRNLMPASFGLILFIGYIITMVIFTSIFFFSENLDNATQAFIIAVYVDFTQCLCSPVLMIVWSPDTMRRLKSIVSRFC